jgi:putative membrane-bound dehydrogenase-like protein
MLCRNEESPLPHVFPETRVNAVNLTGWFGLLAAGFFGLLAMPAAPLLHGAEIEERTGPKTEARFPSLKVPPGFRTTLFACDPLVEYPSVIAIGPRFGSLYVAHDYVSGLGSEFVRHSEVRLLEDTDGDRYADKSMLFAGGFNSIQGLAYHAGTVFVMHAPFLTSLADTDGDGRADVRQDLLAGLGIPPEENPSRLHCANGVVAGHDGWLYLALGDQGCDVERAEGDRFLYRGGGILRCRTDGRDLHLFAGGLRNIYDVAFDDELNVFVRDNENDGGDYMIRVCRSFFGADHGYPYLYYERPGEALPPLADLGRGSSAGGVCYLETAFPAEYRGNLIFCEWGRSVVRYARRRAESSFASMQEVEFASGASTDPYGFKPTDIVVDWDGSILVSDWADGQRPKRGRGRVYRIQYVGEYVSADTSAVTKPESAPRQKSIAEWIKQLDSPSYYARVEAQEAIDRLERPGRETLKRAMHSGDVGVSGQMHAVWILAGANENEAIDDLFALAESDADPRVRAQAIRVLADLTDPMMTQHRLDSGRGDSATAARLAAIAEGADPKIVLEVVVALGRLRWSETPLWIGRHLHKPDSSLAHAAMQALRRADSPSAVLQLLDQPSELVARAIALRALANQAEPQIVDGLIVRLNVETDAERRREYADLLTRIYKKPGEWKYWGYRPLPRTPNSVPWEKTEMIEGALERLLAGTDRDLNVLVLKRMLREEIPAAVPTLAAWLRSDRDPDRVAVILDGLGTHSADEIRALLEEVARDREHAVPIRLETLSMWTEGLGESQEGQLLELAERLEDSPVLAVLLRGLGQHPHLSSSRLLLRKLTSARGDVRAAAVQSLTALDIDDAADQISPLLNDGDPRVREAASEAAGHFHLRDADERLLELASDTDPAVQRAALVALRQLGNADAVPAAVSALEHPLSQTAALGYLEGFGSPLQLDDVVQTVVRSPSVDVLSGVVRILSAWDDDTVGLATRQRIRSALAGVHGQSGIVLQWKGTGPISASDAERHRAQLLASEESASETSSPLGWRALVGEGTDARVELTKSERAAADTNEIGRVWLATAEVRLPVATNVEILASAAGSLLVWLNGDEVYRRDETADYQPDSDRFDAQLPGGLSRVLVQIESDDKMPRFHLRFRKKSSKQEHEHLARIALRKSGNVRRGRDVFLNAEKSLCVRCHRLGDNDSRIGPELTGVGDRFSRIHLIESILEPSRTVAPSYETVVVALTSGIIRTGVKLSETETALSLGDNEGKVHVIQLSDIEERVVQAKSTMPEGIEKRLTEEEFIDLIGFLVSQKRKPRPVD